MMMDGVVMLLIITIVEIDVIRYFVRTWKVKSLGGGLVDEFHKGSKVCEVEYMNAEWIKNEVVSGIVCKLFNGYP